MLNITYTISPQLSQTLLDIDVSRQRILTTILQPPFMRQLFWQQQIHSLTAINDFGGLSLSQSAIQTVCKELRTYPTGDPRQLIANYRWELYRLRETWTVNPKRVTPSDLQDVYAALSRKTSRRPPPFPLPETDTKQLLSYIQSQDEHPLVAAAVVSGQCILYDRTILTYTLAALVGRLFLFKGGFTAGGLFPYETALLRESRELTLAGETMEHSGNMNPWLSATISAVSNKLADAERSMAQQVTPADRATPGFSLNARQQQILSLAAVPGNVLTNKLVRKKFRISQITASRDLSKLAAIGELYPHGKGRSVYYTKV